MPRTTRRSEQACKVVTRGHGRQHRSRSAAASHLLGPSLTWQESGRAFPAARRPRTPGRRAQDPPLSPRRPEAAASPPAARGLHPAGAPLTGGSPAVPGRPAPVPGEAPRLPRTHPAERASGRPTPLARPPFLPHSLSGRRDPAPPPVTYLVTEFEERHGGRLRRRPSPPLPPL